MEDNEEFESVENSDGSEMESVAEWQDSMLGNNEKMIREFTTDTSIPERVQLREWALTSKHSILSNMKDDDRRIFVRTIRNQLTRRRQFVPYYKITPIHIDTDSQTVILANMISTRAQGTDRERKLLARQSVEKRLVTDNERETKSGFGGRLKSFFGFGGGDV